MAGVAAAIGVIAAVSHEANSESNKMAESAKANKRAYDDLMKSQSEKTKTDTAEIGRTQELWKELQSVTDENGNIKDGYQARVDFILGQLNSALGTEIQRNGEVITSYDKIKGSIDTLIAKKRASILLDIAEDGYRTSLTESKKIEAEQIKNQIAVMEQKNTVSELEAKFARDRATSIDPMLIKGDAQVLYSAKQKLSQEEAAYNQNEATLKNYHKNIADYESASAASIQGDYAAVERALDSKDRAYADSTTATDEQLRTQAINSEIAYNNLEQRLREHDSTVTQESVDSARELANKDKAAYLNVSEESASGYILGWNENGDAIFQAGSNAENQALSGVSDSGNNMGAEGENQAGNYASGWISGIRAWLGNIWDAAYGFVSHALDAGREAQDSHSPSKKTHVLGINYGEGYELGIKDKIGDVKSAAKSMVSGALISNPIAPSLNADIAHKITGYSGSVTNTTINQSTPYSLNFSLPIYLNNKLVKEQEFAITSAELAQGRTKRMLDVGVIN